MSVKIENILSNITHLLFSIAVSYFVLFSINYATDIDGRFFCMNIKSNTTLTEKNTDYEHSLESNFVDISDLQIFSVKMAPLMIYVTNPFYTISQFTFKTSHLEEVISRYIDPPII